MLQMALGLFTLSESYFAFVDEIFYFNLKDMAVKKLSSSSLSLKYEQLLGDHTC